MATKFILIIGDGMADRPLSQLGGRTPLQSARKPHIDSIARRGRIGLNQTVPHGMEPGSDVATLGLLGYDVAACYTGRAPIEAAAMGVAMEPHDVAVRTNLVFLKDGRMADYSAGHIPSGDGKRLIAEINKQLGKKGEIEFYPGVSYRNLLVLRKSYSDEVVLTPPHDIPGKEVAAHLPRAHSPAGRRTAELLNNLITASQRILPAHPLNGEKSARGEPHANSVWFWGIGRKPALEPFKDKWGLRAAVISAVDLIKGIGVLTGMSVISVPGATGYLDTNYEGKANAALLALERHDLVIVHIEATDETGHEGDAGKKVRAIEELDSRIVKPLLAGLEKKGFDYVVAVSPDHETPVSLKTHGPSPVPWAAWRKGEDNASLSFDEQNAAKGAHLKGDEFMRLFLSLGKN
ncbi:MAG: cofactor-independent phosphoglycerate mutase [Candidatus Micrarchaeia archaeon]